MTCKNIKEQFTEFLSNELDLKNREYIQNHLEGCKDCRDELQEINQIWTKLGVLPEIQPSRNLRQSFYKNLEIYKKDHTPQESQSLKTWFIKFTATLIPDKPLPQFVMVVFLLIIGFGLGNLLTLRNKTHSEMKSLKTEVNNMQKLLAISLLKQKSSSDRIMGVNQTFHIPNPDSSLIKILFSTLNSDSNVNVRLATLNTLYSQRHSPQVKKDLYNSLPLQDSPLVQISLIDLISEIPSLESIYCLEDFLKKDQLHPDVITRAKMVLEQLNTEISSGGQKI